MLTLNIYKVRFKLVKNVDELDEYDVNFVNCDEIVLDNLLPLIFFRKKD